MLFIVKNKRSDSRQETNCIVKRSESRQEQNYGVILPKKIKQLKSKSPQNLKRSKSTIGKY